MPPQHGVHRKERRTYDIRGHAHELTFSCHGRLPLLANDRTRAWLAEAIEGARARLDFAVWAYVFMPEHVHLLVFPRSPQATVANMLRAIKLPVARKAITHLKSHAPEFLERLAVRWPSGRVERRFWQQGGGYDRNLWEQEALWASVEYIEHNPVRRGLVKRAIDWPWSSAPWRAGERDVPIRIDAML